MKLNCSKIKTLQSVSMIKQKKKKIVSSYHTLFYNQMKKTAPQIVCSAKVTAGVKITG